MVLLVHTLEGSIFLFNSFKVSLNKGGLLVHGLKGRRPKLSEEKKVEILNEETIRFRQICKLPMKSEQIATILVH